LAGEDRKTRFGIVSTVLDSLRIQRGLSVRFGGWVATCQPHKRLICIDSVRAMFGAVSQPSLEQDLDHA
jgi:hypothetical protein